MLNKNNQIQAEHDGEEVKTIWKQALQMQQQVTDAEGDMIGFYIH